MITSPYSFVASANCAIYEGATPVFADIDPQTLNLDPAAVEAAITPRTKAIVAVDIFGYPVRARRAASRSASGTGSRSSRTRARRSARATRAGRSARTATRRRWAFYPNKQMTTGEGGAVTTGSAEEHELLVSLRNQGRLETSSWLQHGRLGFNYRLDDISAALGIGQLEKLDRILAGARARSRRATASCSPASTSSRRSPTTPTTSARGSSTSSSSPRGVDRDGVIGAARRRGHRVRAVPAVDPPPVVHARAVTGSRRACCPVSEDASARTMAIPFHARLERDDQERVVEALRTALASV